MYIQEGTIVIKITLSEAYTMAWEVYRSLLLICKENSTQSPDTFIEREREAIARMRLLFEASGYSNIYENQMKGLLELLKKPGTQTPS